MRRPWFAPYLVLFAGCSFDPTAAQQHLVQGDMHLTQKDYRGAIGMYDLAIKSDPTLRDAYLHRGIAYRGIGDFQSSYANIEVAIRLDPNDSKAYAERARLKIEKLLADADGDKVKLAAAFAPNDPKGISADLDIALSKGDRLIDANTRLLHGAVRLMQNRDADAQVDFDHYLRMRSKVQPDLEWAIEHWKKERPVLDLAPIDELGRQMQRVNKGQASAR